MTEEEEERLKRLFDDTEITEEDWNTMLANDELKRLQKEKETEESDDDYWFEPEPRECDWCERMFMAYHEDDYKCGNCAATR